MTRFGRRGDPTHDFGDLDPVRGRNRLIGPAVAYRPGRYRPIVGPSRFFRLLIVGWIAVEGIFVAYQYATLQVMERIAADPLAVGAVELFQVEERLSLISWVQIIGSLVMGVATAAWLFRAYRNVLALGAGGARFGPGWAIGGWFVPILNLVRPKQVIDDTWRGSRPDADPVTLGTRDPVPWHLHLWWASFLVTLAFSQIGSAALRSARSPGDLEEVMRFLYVRDVAALAASLLLERIVAGITVRMAGRAAALGIDVEPRPGWIPGWRGARPAERLRVLGPAMVAAAMVAAGTWSFDASIERVETNPAGSSGVFLADLVVGDCVDGLEEAVVFAVVRRLCDESHAFEVFAIVVHGHPPGAAYPGDDTVAIEADTLCLERFSGYVGAEYEDSILEVWFIHPLSGGWALGDRRTVCLAANLDGSPLERSVRGSGL